VQSFNLIEIWQSMTWLAKAVNIVLAICSVYSLWVIVDRYFGLKAVRSNSIRFAVDLREQLKWRKLEGAMQLATKSDSPIARVVHDALSEYKEGQALLRSRPPNAGESEYDPIEAIERVIERTKEREIADLKRGLGGLASISSAAPFIGLFGTVVGIISAFRAMSMSGQGGLGTVSKGIAEALFTTAVGLVVAIPAVMMFNYFSTVLERFVVDMNGVGSELVSFVLREGAAANIASAQQQRVSQHPPPVHPSNPPPGHPSNPPPPRLSQHPQGPPSGHGPVSRGPASVQNPAPPGYPRGYPPR
jgi:biopolymer transport protein ExbB